MVNRKVTYRLYPNTQQTERMLELLAFHQRVYNTALQERIRIYKEESHSLTFPDQCKALTEWRRKNNCLAEINAQSLQVTLKRLDLAFQAFYRRLKTDEKPGFPRFKSLARYPGWGYKSHGDGWRLFSGKSGQHGKIRLSSVGMISMRGKARTQGDPKTCEILHKSGKWYASITIECQPKRTSGTKAVGFDWGLEKFLVLHDSDNNTETVDNPRHLKSALPLLKKLQQSVSKKTNKQSNNRKKAIKKLAKAHSKIANRRKDFHHQEAARIVKTNGLIGAEVLSVKSMTKKGGRKKCGLNREILSTAPTQFYQLLKSKAEEAGTVWVDIPTREVKPTQTCYRCGIQKKKALFERWHECDCGANCSRDENAARVILNWALKWVSGQELAEMGSRRFFATLNHETPAIPFLG
ncbi:MAG TPA: transposase [Gammaproteobacteria bacterium]|nr:transposase [Gammaproteobacteria bacterium]